GARAEGRVRRRNRGQAPNSPEDVADAIPSLNSEPVPDSLYSGSAQVLPEERDGALPGELRGRLVVARGGVVVEAVLRSRIDERFVFRAIRFQRGFVTGPHGVDALVVLGVVDEEQRLDLRHRGRVGRGSV